jgi:primosomal protein N' (replication factor Y)
MPILRLAIPSPLRQLFDYLPPLQAEPRQLQQLRPGCRITVPFGNRELCAILVETVEQAAVGTDQLRHAIKIVDPVPLISPSLLDLCTWAAGYYKYPLGEIMAAALPTVLRQGKHHLPDTITHWRLSVAGKGLPEGALPRAPRQAEMIGLLQRETSMDSAALKHHGISNACRKQLLDKGLVETCEMPPARLEPSSKPGPELNEEQRQAVAAIGATLGGFSAALLQGVTGSGKTEVYLRLIEQVICNGKQALILVPEIGLTPQTIARFQGRFNAEIAVLHSGLADGARQRAWESARSGRAHIVIGTRSAIFASLAFPGLIVVDEEHDNSFKQHEGFRYSARDLAVKRAQLEQVPVILGSATPSLESLHNALEGRYQRFLLQQRANNAKLPEIKVLDIRHRPLQAGLSEELLTATRSQLDAGNQVLLFLNRRGYAHALQCHDCGYVAECRHCDSRLTLHRRAGELRCHHCDWRQRTPRNCPDCGSRSLDIRGVGTEQTESLLLRLLPQYPLHRVDRDSMQRRGAMEDVLRSVNTGDPCILLGTQMLTKGHHFPDVTLVGMLDTDGALFSPDFRGPERMGQLLTQVGGRAGRADKPGRVILQTHYPDHPLLLTLLEQGYAGYALKLLEERRQAGFPPYGQLLLVRAEARSMEQAEEFLRIIKQRLADGSKVQYVGPLPAPLQRKSGRYRAQLLVIGKSRPAVQKAGEAIVGLAQAIPEGKRLRWSLDVDPLDML